MAIVVVERADSRPTTAGENPTVDLEYVILGTESDTDAHTQLLATAPSTYGGLVLQSSSIEHAGYGIWYGTVRYGKLAPREVGDYTFNFDTSGGNVHITQSLSTVAKYLSPRYGGTAGGDDSSDPDTEAPDFGGAIGVSKDGVQGVDVLRPNFTWSETHRMSLATVIGDAYLETLSNLTGTVNQAAFRRKPGSSATYAAGTVMFLGATGTQTGDDEADVTFRFAHSRNATGLTIGDMGGISKKGWEYLWVLYEDAEDDEVSVLIKRPIAVYVEQVSSYGDFSGLGI